MLLPLEALSGLLRRLSQAAVDTLQLSDGGDAPELLKVLTEPLTTLIIQVLGQTKYLQLRVGGEKKPV